MNRRRHQTHNPPGARSSPTGLGVAAAALLTVAAVTAAHATEMKIVKKEGGISPMPLLSAEHGTNNMKVSWQSFGNQVKGGSNVVYTVTKCPVFKGTNSTWSTVATVTNATSVSVPTDGDVGFLQVSQEPGPTYAGAEKCGLCHYDTHQDWMTTAHSGAFQTLKNAKMDKNASCLPCHTVGFGTPTGFIDEATTPALAGVQCENCHGPAGAHAAKPLDKNNQPDKALLPVKTLTAQMCGGCHSDAHHPTYEEWATSAHGTTQIPEEEFADPVNGPGRMTTCGACHSAATRLALLRAVEINPDPTQFSPELPSTEEAASTGITCAACHNPHAKGTFDAQLRFPLHSEVDYSYITTNNFAANYKPDVQTCAQCHNMRGALWTGTSRPPHHSPQYNILIGKGGYEAGVTNVPQSYHMAIEDQCAQCHTHPHSPPAVTESSPNYMGHDFRPTTTACAPCHDEVASELLIQTFQANTKQQIQDVKGLLDQWALTKAPADLQKYGVLAWEFTNIGQLSKPTPDHPTGPSSTEQRQIPDGIKQARFNLYLVEHDGSYGVHNGAYGRFLLQVARDQVNAALAAQ